MAILEKFEKQPADVQDFDISYVDWLADMADTAVSSVVTTDPGIVLDSHSLTNGVVKVWLSGGTSGVSYKVTATLTTTAGRVKQSEIVVKVREY